MLEKMDIFVEQIIHKKFGTKDYLIFAGVGVGFILVMSLALLFLPPAVWIFVFAGLCYGSYYLCFSRSIEFEYSVTNGDLTIDKIINRRKRKRVISFDVKNAEEMGPYKAQTHTGRAYEKKVFAAKTDDGLEEGSWYISARTPKTGYTLVVFHPEEKVLTAIKPFLPRQVQQNAFPRT